MLYIDPVGAIAKMHREGTRKVPYPVFMTCFTKLLKDPGSVEPLPPSEELKQYFRAVCMALDLGIADPERREENRRREFFERIYPAWKAALPEAEFQTYQEILDGKLRERIERDRREQQQREAEEAQKRREELAAARSEEERRAMFQRLMRAALRETETEEEAVGAAATAVAGPTPERRTVEELATAVARGELPIWYSDPASRKPYACYRYRNQTVVVQLVKTRHTYCLAVRYPKGYARRVGAGVIINKLMQERGYVERKPFSYFKEQYFFVTRIRFGSTSTNIVQQRRAEFTVHALAQALRAVHAELERILDALEGTWAERPEEQGEASTG